MTKKASAEQQIRKWHTDDPTRLVKRGHPVGDFMEAHKWDVLERAKGRLRVRAHLPKQVRNPRGELFGGFTPTYVDFISLYTYHSDREPDEPRQWLSTANMRVDYFAPIVGPTFEILAEMVHRQGRTGHVLVQFFDTKDRRTAMAHVTLVQHRAKTA